jgi:hypothetical protein
MSKSLHYDHATGICDLELVGKQLHFELSKSVYENSQELYVYDIIKHKYYKLNYGMS